MNQELETMADFRVEQLTKEMVVARLKALGDPATAAVEIAKKTVDIVLNTTNSIDPSREVVRDVCHGTMVGLLLSEQNMARGGVLLLTMIADFAAQRQLDSTEMMTAALQGMADMQNLLTPEQIDDIRRAVSMEFIGADQTFMALVSKVQQAQKAGQKL